MRAVVLAGGKGIRLLPYTTLIPKPLVPLGGKYTILEIVIMQLAKAGFDHITLAVNHLSNLIMAYLGNGSKWGVKLDYSLEENALSTIAPLTLIEDLPNNFLVMNGDILCNLDYRSFFNNHVNKKADISVASYERKVDVDFGVIKFDTKNQLIAFNEKPSYTFNVSMGIYCLNRQLIEKLEKNKPYGFDTLMKDAIKLDHKVAIEPFDGFWLDIGRPDDYDAANQNFDSIYAQLGIS